MALDADTTSQFFDFSKNGESLFNFTRGTMLHQFCSSSSFHPKTFTFQNPHLLQRGLMWSPPSLFMVDLRFSEICDEIWIPQTDLLVDLFVFHTRLVPTLVQWIYMI